MFRRWVSGLLPHAAVQPEQVSSSQPSIAEVGSPYPTEMFSAQAKPE
jgi:hypothetical protein